MSSDGPSNTTFAVALGAALGGPVLYAAVNLVDKVAISRRVRHTNSYLAIVGIFDAVFGSMIGLFGTWRGPVVAHLHALDWLWPVFGGLSLGVAMYFYYFALEGADVSKVVGMENVYPLIVCVLSYFFLQDPISLIGYCGIGITTLGALMLSLNATRALVRLVLRLNCLEKQRKAFDERTRELEEAEEAEAEEDDEDDESPPDGPDLFRCCKVAWARCRGHKEEDDGEDEDDDDDDESSSDDDEKHGAPPVGSINAKRSHVAISVNRPLLSESETDGEVSDGAEKLGHGVTAELGEPMPDSETEGFPRPHRLVLPPRPKTLYRSHSDRSIGARRAMPTERSRLARTSSSSNLFEKPSAEAGHGTKRWIPAKSFGRLPLVRPGGKDGEAKKQETGFLAGNCVMVLIIPLVVLIALNEFFTKMATNHMPENNVACINSATFGVTLSAVIVLPSARKHFVWELRYNWMWALLSEVLTLAAAYCLVLAMAGLSAPIVSSLAATQPFYILCLERVARIAPDTCGECMLYKLVPVSVIITGVVLISFSVASN
jgi:uncharacterized membrane protein